MNIHVFVFFDDEGQASQVLVNDQKNYLRVANLLYWYKHYSVITNNICLFTDITK